MKSPGGSGRQPRKRGIMDWMEAVVHTTTMGADVVSEVLMNAGAALYLGGKAESMKEGVRLAAELIDSGKALETLERLIEVSNRPEVEA